MEGRLHYKVGKTVKKTNSRIVSAQGFSKSSKVSPMESKRKMQNQVSPNCSSKNSKTKLTIKDAENLIQGHTGMPYHRRNKSDPIPSSPYTSKTVKNNNPPKKQIVIHAKPSKGHRRNNSDSANLKKVDSNPLFVQETEDSDREKVIENIKNCFHLGMPLVTSIDYYKIGKPLGKGAFGKVYLGIHKLSGLKVAIKTIEKSFIQDERSRKKVFQEVYIMNKIHDKNVIRLLELFESPRHLMIVLEYAGGGDLLQLLRSRGKITEKEARPIFKQIIDAVTACHKEDIIHRDIKLDNILLNEEMTLIKLCDFGVSRVAKRGFKINEQCGTPAYLAPEIIVNEGYEPFFVDVWSMGILLECK